MAAVALLVAAGEGRRLGAGQPKGLVGLAGRPLLWWSLEALLGCPAVSEVVVALPPAALEAAAELELPAGVKVVGGGESRSLSVRNALAAAGPGEVVVVHDAARPLVEPALVEAVVGALGERFEAAIAAAPIADTVKEVRRDGEQLVVAATLDRSRLWAVQTPQAFKRSALERALAQGREALLAASDDASLVERQGGRVAVVENRLANPKVTTPFDLELCGLLLTRSGRAVVQSR